MRSHYWIPTCLLIGLLFESCSSPRFNLRKAGSETGTPLEGYASYYADEFHGRRTSNGETYDMHAMTAAHRTLPFGTKVRVSDPATSRSVLVRINDRGPFKGDRIIDLSYGAARQLGMIGPGTLWVRLEVISPD